MSTLVVQAIMRKPAAWMRSVDERILEVLESEGPKTPKQMSSDGEGWVANGMSSMQQRCFALHRAGLLDRPAHGLYQISDDGRRFLTGEYDARGLSNPLDSAGDSDAGSE